MKIQGDYTVVGSQDVFDIDFQEDLSSGRVYLDVNNSYRVDFTNRAIRTILGFNSAEYTADTESPNTADVFAGVETILVHSNLVAGKTYLNGNQSDIISSFSATGYAPNESISITPDSFFVPINTTSEIREIRLNLTDQSGRRINLNNAHLCISLYFRPVH
jgi:hypothetical protein